MSKNTKRPTRGAKRGPYIAGKQRMRRRIVEAAELVFFESGFRATSVERICQQAGISTATFYAHFPEGKLAALSAAVSASAEALREQAGLAKTLGSLESLGGALQKFAFGREMRGLVRLAIAEGAQVPEMMESYEQAYRDVIDLVRGALTAELGQELAAVRAELFYTILVTPDFLRGLITDEQPNAQACEASLARAIAVARGKPVR